MRIYAHTCIACTCIACTCIASTHACICIHAGIELLAFTLAIEALAPPAARVSPLSLGFVTISVVGLLLGPSLLNPHCFRLADAIGDLKHWASWLLRPHFVNSEGNADRSWSAFHQQRCTDKLWQGKPRRTCGWQPRARFVWLPSKEHT